MERERDSVDDMIEQWGREWPALDVTATALLGRIARIEAHLERRRTATLAGHLLSGYAFKLLASLRRAGPPYRLTPGELSRTLLVSTGAMTHQVDQLEEAGLVVRRPDPTDRRVVLVELTAAGRQRVDAALLAHTERERAALAPLTESERAMAARLLRKLLFFLEEGPLQVGKWASASETDPEPTGWDGLTGVDMSEPGQ